MCFYLYRPYIKMLDRPPSISVSSECNEMNMKPSRLRSERHQGHRITNVQKGTCSRVCLIRARGGLAGSVCCVHIKLPHSLSAHVLRSDSELGDGEHDDSSEMNACVRPSALFYLCNWSLLRHFTAILQYTHSS